MNMLRRHWPWFAGPRHPAGRSHSCSTTGARAAISGFVLTLMSEIGVMAIFALSYNMLMGQAGLLSFGHAVAARDGRLLRGARGPSREGRHILAADRNWCRWRAGLGGVVLRLCLRVAGDQAARQPRFAMITMGASANWSRLRR